MQNGMSPFAVSTALSLAQPAMEECFVNRSELGDFPERDLVGFWASPTAVRCLVITPTPLSMEILAENGVAVLEPHSKQIVGVMWAASWGLHIHKGTFHDSAFPI